MKELLSSHFDKIWEMSILVFIFVFAVIMLAFFPQREEMSRFIENGAIIAILARAFGGQVKSAPATPAPTPDTPKDIKEGAQ